VGVAEEEVEVTVAELLKEQEKILSRLFHASSPQF
jgi:hypothetical protein